MARRKNNSKYSKNTRDERKSEVDGKISDTESTSSPTEKSNGAQASIPSSRNDPEWYSRDPRLVIDGASIPFSKPFGDRIDFFKGVSVFPGGNTPSNIPSEAIPGVCSLKLKPSFGASADKTSPINVCANALYTHVRYVNSGRKNYDPADLFMYAAAFGDIYSFVCWCIRLYHYAFMYSQRNWYVGKDLILGNHVNADDLVTNLANFRYWINSIINKVSSFCLPDDIYFFKRRVFLYSNYYLENPYGNLKDQLYQFTPEGFFCFEFDSNNAGKLAYKNIIGANGGQPLKIVHIQAYFEQFMMANITGDEDFGLMSGDILKAYTTDHILKVEQIPEEGGLMPVHDPYVLSQFKNAFIVSNLLKQDPNAKYKDLLGNDHQMGDLEQTTNGLLVSCESVDWSATGCQGECAWFAGQHLLTVEAPDPNPGDVLEATRLQPGLAQYPMNDGSGTYFYGLTSGTEIVTAAIVATVPCPTGDTLAYYTAIQGSAFVNPSLGLYRIAMAFKYIPLFYDTQVDPNDSTAITDFLPMGNLDNTTLVDNEIVKRLHEIALLSLFYVPGVAKLIS